jgi:putative transposase
VILYAVFFYLRYAVSYRDLEEIMAERGAEVDHATLNRGVVKFAPLIASRAQERKRPTATSWRMDETYIKAKGRWTGTAPWIGMAKPLISCCQSAVIWPLPDGSSSGRSARTACRTVEVLQVKYLNNILEQDHRFIKRITAPMLGFKAFHSATATLAGIETAHMIRKGQFGANGHTAFQQFAALAA